MTRDHFPYGVAEQLKWYVYRLIDPRNGETFYVGKGQSNRVFDHAKGLPPDEADEMLDPKLHRIKEIQAAGLEVGHVIHRHGLSTSHLAHEVEAALIDAYPGLTNKVRGRGSRDYGSRHVEEIIDEYAGEEFEVKEPLMLISVSTYYNLRDDSLRRSSLCVESKPVSGRAIQASTGTRQGTGSRSLSPQASMEGRYPRELPRLSGALQ